MAEGAQVFVVEPRDRLGLELANVDPQARLRHIVYLLAEFLTADPSEPNAPVGLDASFWFLVDAARKVDIFLGPGVASASGFLLDPLHPWRLGRCEHRLCLFFRHSRAKRFPYVHNQRHYLGEPVRGPRGDPGIIGVKHTRHLPHQHRHRLSGLTSVGASLRYIMFAITPGSLPNRCWIMLVTAAKIVISMIGDSTHPFQRPCSTPNVSEDSPSSKQTHALMPSLNCVRFSWLGLHIERVPLTAVDDPASRTPPGGPRSTR